MISVFKSVAQVKSPWNHTPHSRLSLTQAPLNDSTTALALLLPRRLLVQRNGERLLHGNVLLLLQQVRQIHHTRLDVLPVGGAHLGEQAVREGLRQSESLCLAHLSATPKCEVFIL